MLIISYKASEEFKVFLKANDIEFILTTPNPKLDPRIDDHPDLSLFKLDDKNIVIAESVYDYYKEKINGYNRIKGEDPPVKYPHDALYNVVRFKDFYIHNDFTEKHKKKYFKENPPISEDMIAAMMSQMGQKPSAKKLNQVMNMMKHSQR